MRHILTSRSSENLLTVKCGEAVLSSPKSKKGTRRSLKSRAQSHSPESQVDSCEPELLKEKEQQLKLNLDKISLAQR